MSLPRSGFESRTTGQICNNRHWNDVYRSHKEKPLPQIPLSYKRNDAFILQRLSGAERHYNGCWAIAREILDFSLIVETHDGRLHVRPDNLDPIDDRAVRRQIAALLKRIQKLRKLELDRGAIAVLEILGKQTFLTEVEERLLMVLEDYYGIAKHWSIQWNQLHPPLNLYHHLLALYLPDHLRNWAVRKPRSGNGWRWKLRERSSKPPSGQRSSRDFPHTTQPLPGFLSSGVTSRKLRRRCRKRWWHWGSCVISACTAALIIGLRSICAIVLVGQRRKFTRIVTESCYSSRDDCSNCHFK